jgi:hypothetical protein
MWGRLLLVGCFLLPLASSKFYLVETAGQLLVLLIEKTGQLLIKTTGQLRYSLVGSQIVICAVPKFFKDSWLVP